MYHIQYIQESDKGQEKKKQSAANFLCSFLHIIALWPSCDIPNTFSACFRAEKTRVYIGVCVRDDDSHRLPKYVI